MEEKSLTDLLELKTALQSVCDDYAKELTTYAALNGDAQFRKMNQDIQKKYNMRGKFVDMLGIVKEAIENKLLKEFDNE